LGNWGGEQPETIQLADELIEGFHTAAVASKNPNANEKALNVRYGTAQFQTQDIHTPKFNRWTLLIFTGDHTFELTVTKMSTRPNVVEFKEVLK